MNPLLLTDVKQQYRKLQLYAHLIQHYHTPIQYIRYISNINLYNMKSLSFLQHYRHRHRHQVHLQKYTSALKTQIFRYYF